jgi:hypothetical protein
MTGTGKATVETLQGLLAAFNAHDDVHYGQDRHWVSGDRGCSEWLLTGATTQGSRSWCAAATCSSSGVTRSPARTPTGSWWTGEHLGPRRDWAELALASRPWSLGRHHGRSSSFLEPVRVAWETG